MVSSTWPQGRHLLLHPIAVTAQFQRRVGTALPSLSSIKEVMTLQACSSSFFHVEDATSKFSQIIRNRCEGGSSRWKDSTIFLIHLLLYYRLLSQSNTQFVFP